MNKHADEVDENKLEERSESKSKADDVVDVQSGGVTHLWISSLHHPLLNTTAIIEFITHFLITIAVILIKFTTLGFVLPPKPILVTERMVMIPREVRDGVSVFTIQKATWRNVLETKQKTDN